MAIVQNVYTDEERQKKLRKRFEDVLQPQIQAQTQNIARRISPFERGRIGAALTEEVARPATTELAKFQLEQEKLGQQFDVENPYREADYTGLLGGVETMAGKSLGSQLASAAQQREYLPKQFGLQEKGFEFQKEQAQLGGQRNLLGDLLTLAGQGSQPAADWAQQLMTQMGGQLGFTPQIGNQLGQGGLVPTGGQQESSYAEQLGFPDEFQMNAYLEANPEDAPGVIDPRLSSLTIENRGEARRLLDRLFNIADDPEARGERLDKTKKLRRLGFTGSAPGITES